MKVCLSIAYTNWNKNEGRDDFDRKLGGEALIK